MNIFLHSPFGLLTQEATTLFLLAKYLGGKQGAVSQLICNGIFSLCERDAESEWGRGLLSCSACIGEQRMLGQMCNLSYAELSTYLDAAQVSETKRWIDSVKNEELLSCTIEKTSVFELCVGSFQSRFGTVAPNLDEIHHEEVLRRLLLASARMLLASNNFLVQERPELLLVAGGEDFITRTLLYQSYASNVPSAMIRWDPVDRQVLIVRSPAATQKRVDVNVYSSELLALPQAEWPLEVRRSICAIAQFLDVPLHSLLDPHHE